MVQSNNNEKKVKMKQKKNNKQKYMSKQSRVSSIRIERKDEYVCMLQNEAYRKSMTTRAYQGYANCKRKAKVNNKTYQ